MVDGDVADLIGDEMPHGLVRVALRVLDVLEVDPLELAVPLDLDRHELDEEDRPRHRRGPSRDRRSPCR
ncbi:MAG TPA: hypothetical protein VHF22_09605, partial [Planctomycetota bacterium]|nr:hypothetical protein [Planctomycetota bacterium]